MTLREGDNIYIEKLDAKNVLLFKIHISPSVFLCNSTFFSFLFMF